VAHIVHTIGGEKKRVQSRTPHRLVDRTDALANVLGEDRTDILVTALREYLQEAVHDDAITQEIAAAYYDGEISFEQLKALVGAEEAANLRVLKQQLARRAPRECGRVGGTVTPAVTTNEITFIRRRTQVVLTQGRTVAPRPT